MEKLQSPSAERNKEPIWNVIESHIDFPKERAVRALEIAAGSGIHTVFLASHLQSKCNVAWYPADTDERYRQSISVYASERPELMIRDPLTLTLDETGIQEDETKKTLTNDAPFHLILNVNMIHISPWSATIGLMSEAASLLAKDGGTLLLYGPYKINGKCCPSNQSFDISLRSRNSEWGLRDLERVVELAATNRLHLEQTIEMPANNLCLLFRHKL